MASQKAEDGHVAMLNKLLADSGLECLRSPADSTQSSSTSGPIEEQLPEKIADVPTDTAIVAEEEDKTLSSELLLEEQAEIFPTPSLRRVLPEKVRKIEDSHRIQVLPEEFNTEIDPQAIPKIKYTAQQRYIDILADIVGCKNYKNSLAEYWFLDTLANLLRKAQNDKLDRPTQAVLILWFCEWMKEMQHFDAADRQRMLRRFKVE